MRFYGVLLAMYVGASVLMAQEEAVGSVRLKCEPRALVSINQGPSSWVEDKVLTVRSDEETLLRVEAPGYQTAYRTIRLEAGERLYETFKLKRAWIPVVLQTNVPAVVSCEGREIGKTPLVLPQQFNEARIYQLTFRAQGFQIVRKNLNLSNGKPQVMQVALESTSGTLVLTSEPSGAEVSMNGLSKGVTPCTLERIQAGKIKLKVVKKGWQTIEHELTIEPGVRYPINFPMKPAVKSILVTAQPLGARILINGRECGLSRVQQPMEGEACVVKVEKEGYASQSRTVQLRSGEEVSVAVDLVPIPGTLLLQSSPGRVTVKYTACNVSKAHALTLQLAPQKEGDAISEKQRIQLDPGDYRFEFSAQKYYTETRVLTIRPSQETKLRVNLVFKPNFEVQTASGKETGYLIDQDSATGNIRLELKPGTIRTYLGQDILSKRWLEEGLQ